MPDDLPKLLDLNRIGGTPVTLTGRLELKQLPRLRDMAWPGGYASLHLQAVAEQGQRFVSGQIRAELALTCQRCLSPMTYSVITETKLVWVHAAEGAESVPDGYDALVSATGRMSVASLVEDELLLALPLVARHEPPEKCVVTLLDGENQPPVVTGNHVPGPFAVLKALKRH